MHRPLRWYDTVTINVFFLGLTTVAQTNGLVVPLLVQEFVGEAAKATYFGSLRLWTLMAALLAQSAMGMLSDRSTLPWGRRRPFIFAGTLLSLVFIGVIAFSMDMQGMAGYWLLFAMAILLQFSSNIAQSAQQGLIPDLVPQEKRGLFSGVKALLEIPLPLLFVSLVIARLISGGSMLAALLLAGAVLAATMLVALLAPERPLQGPLPRLDWSPFMRLALMTLLFTAVILGAGQVVRISGRLVQGLGSPALMLLVLGLAGLSAMAVSVALGVWLSVRLSLGVSARRNRHSGLDRSFTWWVINRLAFLVGAVNLSTFAVYFVQARLGYRGQEAAGPASVLMLVVGVFILAAALPGGWLADRFGHKRLVALSTLLAALGTLIALLYPSLELIYIGGCLIGVATGIFFTANWALGTSLVPQEAAGRYLGLSNLAGAGAGAVGAYIGGPIADTITAALPQMPGVGYVLLFSIYGLLFLLSFIALGQIKVTPKIASGEPHLAAAD